LSPYDHDFYATRHKRTAAMASKVLSVLSELIPPIESAVDVGCGVGTWLAVLRERGVELVHGTDGPWVDIELLEIPRECFTARDLSREWEPARRYDLAMSLEVAEHIAPESARTFVTMLTRLSDFVLFSAAIPGQRGVGHVNEQWPDYWAALFEELGYPVQDVVRGQIWHDQSISRWYRQNALLFVRKGRESDLNIDPGTKPAQPLSIVHPGSFLSCYERAYQPSFYRSLQILGVAITRGVRRAIGRPVPPHDDPFRPQRPG